MGLVCPVTWCVLRGPTTQVSEEYPVDLCAAEGGDDAAWAPLPGSASEPDAARETAYDCCEYGHQVQCSVPRTGRRPIPWPGHWFQSEHQTESPRHRHGWVPWAQWQQPELCTVKPSARCNFPPLPAQCSGVPEGSPKSSWWLPRKDEPLEAQAAGDKTVDPRWPEREDLTSRLWQHMGFMPPNERRETDLAGEGDYPQHQAPHQVWTAEELDPGRVLGTLRLQLLVWPLPVAGHREGDWWVSGRKRDAEMWPGLIIVSYWFSFFWYFKVSVVVFKWLCFVWAPSLIIAAASLRHSVSNSGINLVEPVIFNHFHSIAQCLFMFTQIWLT